MRRRAYLTIFLCLFVSAFPLFCDDDDKEQLTQRLGEAISNRNMAAALSLLEAGADPNGYVSRTKSFLTEALTRSRTNKDGDLQIAQLLFDHGADPNLRNHEGRTVAFYASWYGNITHPQLIKFLASNGVRFDVVDNRGWTPIIYQIDRAPGIVQETKDGIITILEWEQENSPNFSAGYESRPAYLAAVLSKLLSRHEDLDRRDLRIVEALLNAGADPCGRDDEGNLIIFKSRYNRGPTPAVIPLFVERGMPVDELYTFRVESRYIGWYHVEEDKTLLMYMMWKGRRGDTTVIESLLNHGADPNRQNSAGKTALMFALDAADVSFLISCGADPAIKDNEGNSALYYYIKYICEYNHLPEDAVAITEAMIAAGASPTETDSEGNSALSMLIKKSQERENAVQPVLDLVLPYASEEEIKIATARANRIFGQERRTAASDNFSYYAGEYLPAILASTAYLGLSIGMREGAFRHNKTENFMGPFNSVITFTALGTFTTAFLFLGDGGLDAIGRVLLAGFFGFGLGFVGGIALTATNESVRNAFNTNPFLYYAAPAVLFTISIARIWWD